MRRWVITGATGHIGNNLVRLLNAERPEDEVIALLRHPAGPELAGTHCRMAVGQLDDEAFLRSVIRAGDTVVHLACRIDLRDRGREETFRVNVGLTEHLLAVCRTVPVGRFLYAGSVDGIAKSGDGVICEPEDYDPAAVSGNYGRSKAAAMHRVLQVMREEPDFPAAMVLPTAVIGPEDRKPSAVGRVIRSCIAGKPEFGIPGGYDFVDVRDVCRALLTLGEGTLRDQYILSGHPVSVEQLYRDVNRLLGVRRRPVIFPTALVRPFVPLTRTLNKITLKALTEPHSYSCTRATAAFGYQPTPWEDTVRDTEEWFRNTAPDSAE